MLKYTTTDRVGYIYGKLGHLGLTKTIIKQILDADAQCIREIILDGNDVCIHNVGTFKIAYKKPTPDREGINPATLERIMIPAKPEYNKVTFKPITSLKDALKEATLGNAIMPNRAKVREDLDAEEIESV